VVVLGVLDLYNPNSNSADVHDGVPTGSDVQ